jgi:hypothetical protein
VHGLSHAPQWAVSTSVSTHDPLQFDSDMQLDEQSESLHTSRAPHPVSQFPHWSWFVVVSTQMPSHSL